MYTTEFVDKHLAPSIPDDSLAHLLNHMELSFEALNVRIARLAIALGVSLKDEQDVANVMHRPAAQVPTQERRSNIERRGFSRTDSGADRRTARSMEELRGLLVLRFDAQRDCIEQLGLVATHKSLREVEEHLKRKGFKPGDDGMDF